MKGELEESLPGMMRVVTRAGWLAAGGWEELVGKEIMINTVRRGLPIISTFLSSSCLQSASLVITGSRISHSTNTYDDGKILIRSCKVAVLYLEDEEDGILCLLSKILSLSLLPEMTIFMVSLNHLKYFFWCYLKYTEYFFWVSMLI